MQGVGNITSSTIHQRTAAQIKEIQRRKKTTESEHVSAEDL